MNQIRNIFALFVFTVFAFSVSAQGKVELPKAVETKQNKRIGEKRADGKTTYYTVLLSFGQNKDAAYNMRAKFLEQYKDSEVQYPTSIQWEDPYFKLYAGKFTNALDAQKLISELKEWLANVILLKKEMDFSAEE